MVLPHDFDRARGRADALAAHTSLGVGGAPRYLFVPETHEECGSVLRACREQGVRVYILGGGYNLLVRDEELPGAVVSTRRLRRFVVSEDRVDVGAGRSFPALVRKAIHLGIPGLPGCPGIPGSIGGAVRMNAGGRHGCVRDGLLEVYGFDERGAAFRRSIRDGDLGYRSSLFAARLVTGAVFRRDLTSCPRAQRALYDEAMAWKKATQPLSAASAGCMFRNPGAAAGGRSAGQLIDEAGLRGRRVGGAVVSRMHANFIVNAGGATARDVHALIRLVQDEVRAAHGVELELEVQTWP